MTDQPPTSAKGAITGEVASVLRSEEELHVEKQLRPFAKVRIRTRLVTETRTLSVQVSREELEIEQQEYDDGSFPDEDRSPAQRLEIVLHEEVLEVVKRVVPVERVLITKHAVMEEREIAVDVRKERVELEEPGEPELR